MSRAIIALTRFGVIAGIAGVVMGFASIAASAVEPAKHTVAWYRTHEQERTRILATCQNDHSFDDNGDCRNAQSASHAALADSLPAANPGSSRDPEADPAYYGHNGGVIAITLAACARNEAPASWCAAAQIASNNLHK